jgi:hypothetical protein
MVPLTQDWQKVTLPFSSLTQPHGALREDFDPADVSRLSWVVGTPGDYEVDLDDVWPEGPPPSCWTTSTAGPRTASGEDAGRARTVARRAAAARRQAIPGTASP